MRGYAEAMGYEAVEFSHEHVVMRHKQSGAEHSIPSTSDTKKPPTQMSLKTWEIVYRRLALGAMDGR